MQFPNLCHTAGKNILLESAVMSVRGTPGKEMTVHQKTVITQQDIVLSEDICANTRS